MGRLHDPAHSNPCTRAQADVSVPSGSCLCPGLGSESPRFLHLQLHFTDLAEVRMRFLGPRFVRACSPCAAPIQYSVNVSPPNFPFLQCKLCPPTASPSAGTAASSDLPFSFSYFSFAQPAPLVFQSADILLSFLGSDLSNICLLL